MCDERSCPHRLRDEAYPPAGHGTLTESGGRVPKRASAPDVDNGSVNTDAPADTDYRDLDPSGAKARDAPASETRR